MRFETECPGCGAVVKRDSMSGRITAHSPFSECQVIRVEDDGTVTREDNAKTTRTDGP